MMVETWLQSFSRKCPLLIAKSSVEKSMSKLESLPVGGPTNKGSEVTNKCSGSSMRALIWALIELVRNDKK
jgi:hypothetical protein